MQDDELAEIRRQLNELRDRNARVEQEKAWETSFARRFVIAGVTWLGAWFWLLAIHAQHAELQALIPSSAYIVSTLSLPFIRRLWLRIRFGGR